jgi:cytochrome c peroxidase
LFGGAPTGIALSEDEDSAFVWCRTTFDLVKVDLANQTTEWYRLADDTAPEDVARGRRLFTNAFSSSLSGGLGCAACHPDGRDDGQVWRESLIDAEDAEGGAVFLGDRSNMKEPSMRRWVDPASGQVGAMQRQPGDPPAPHKYYPRQTPMLAGRVRAAGPYGWHAEASNLIERLQDGFRLHRGPWNGGGGPRPELRPFQPETRRIDALADYLQSGLLPPPVLEHPLTEVEKRGKQLFEDDNVQCARCHVPTTEYTDRTAYPLRALPFKAGFDVEKNTSFKTPSLYFIAGTAPYFHDGSQATLLDLVKNNGSRMGHTEKLSPEDQAALVAYLETL